MSIKTLISKSPLQVALVTRVAQLPLTFNSACIPINKEVGIRCTQLLAILKSREKFSKIGYAGTLDCSASGVFLCLIGNATKLSDSLSVADKTYEATLKLGEEVQAKFKLKDRFLKKLFFELMLQVECFQQNDVFYFYFFQTPSYDADTEVTKKKCWKSVTDANIIGAIQQHFVGRFEQKVPLYSAVHVAGKRLHSFAYNKNSNFDLGQLPTRIVQVFSFSVVSRDGQLVRVRVNCSKGTYVRSLVHDLGQVLVRVGTKGAKNKKHFSQGVGAHVVELKRTAVGDITVDDCWQIETLLQELTKRHRT